MLTLALLARVGLVVVIGDLRFQGGYAQSFAASSGTGEIRGETVRQIAARSFSCRNLAAVG
jgi:hypothetical protein